MVEPANAIASVAKVLLACKRTPAPVDVAAFVGPEPDPVLVWLPVGLYKKKAFVSFMRAQRCRGLGNVQKPRSRLQMVFAWRGGYSRWSTSWYTKRLLQVPALAVWLGRPG